MSDDRSFSSVEDDDCVLHRIGARGGPHSTESGLAERDEMNMRARESGRRRERRTDGRPAAAFASSSSAFFGLLRTAASKATVSSRPRSVRPSNADAADSRQIYGGERERLGAKSGRDG